jgi:hypothetical protein
VRGERVRQIEIRAFQKVGAFVKAQQGLHFNDKGGLRALPLRLSKTPLPGIDSGVFVRAFALNPIRALECGAWEAS